MLPLVLVVRGFSNVYQRSYHPIISVLMKPEGETGEGEEEKKENEEKRKGEDEEGDMEEVRKGKNKLSVFRKGERSRP